MKFFTVNDLRRLIVVIDFSVNRGVESRGHPAQTAEEALTRILFRNLWKVDGLIKVNTTLLVISQLGLVIVI